MKKNNKKARVLMISAAVVSAVYLINKTAFAVSTAKRKLTGGRQSFYSWKFGSIYYTREGTGSPVLLIHDLDAAGCDYEWSRVRDLLAESHTVYTIDLPGCGRSDKEKMIYINYLYVSAVSDFVKRVIKKRTDVITSGISSSIAVMACHGDPQLYGRLIFINPESFDNMVRVPGFSEKLLSRLLLLPLIGTSCYAFMNRRQAVAARLKENAFEYPAGVSRELTDSFREAAFLGGPSARFAQASRTGHYTDVNVTHALREIKNRIYLIGGEKVTDCGYILNGYRFFDPEAECCTVKGKGMPHMEYPEETAAVLEKYMNE